VRPHGGHLGKANDGSVAVLVTDEIARVIAVALLPSEHKVERVLETRLAGLLLGEIAVPGTDCLGELFLIGALLGADVLEPGQGLDALHAETERDHLLEIGRDEALDDHDHLAVPLVQDALLEEALEAIPDQE